MIKNVILLDDHKMICEGIKGFLEANTSYNVIFMTTTKDELYGFVATQTISKNEELCVIVDLQLESELSFDIITYLAKRKIKTIVYSMYESSSYAVRAFECGTSGYVFKSGDEEEIIVALKAVSDGETYLPTSLLKGFTKRLTLFAIFSQKEKTIAELLLTGLSNIEIAEKMNISRRTVENYLSQIGRAHV